MQVLVNFDADGNPQYDSTEDSAVEEIVDSPEADNYIFEVTNSEKNYIWKFLDFSLYFFF